MANNAFAAAELHVVVGIMGWLLYTQVGASSKRADDAKDPPSAPPRPDEKS